jgi:hypothetical protein
MRNQASARTFLERRSAALPFFGMLLFGGQLAAVQQAPSSAEPAGIQTERDAAVEAVKRIINQPVEALPRRSDVSLGFFSPGWFHAGAVKPDFATVDVRKSQTFPYDKWEYVTSDVTADLMFRSSDLEFNSMTKYFYVDRSRPKKRLTEEEMLEVNRLYRIMGRNDAPVPSHQAAAVQRPPADALPTAPLRVVLAAVLGVIVAVGAILYSLRRRLSSKA